MTSLKRLSGLLIAGLINYHVYCQSPVYDHDIFKKSDNYLWHFQYNSANYYLSKEEIKLKNSENHLLSCYIKLKQAEVAFSQELWIEGQMIQDKAKKIYEEKRLADLQVPALIDYNEGRKLTAQRKYNQAVKHFKKAIDAFNSMPEPSLILLSRALILKGNAQIRARRWDAGKSDLEKGLSFIKEVNPESSEFYLHGKYGMGMYYYTLDRDSSFYHFKEGLMRTKSYVNPKNKILASVYEKMGNIYKTQNEYESAHVFLQNALEIRKFHYPEIHPAISAVYNNIGILYNQEKDHENAAIFLKKSLGIDRQIFGNDHNFVAMSLSNLGNVYKWLGEYDKAIEVLEESLEIRKKLFGEYHNYYASSLNNLSLVYERIPDYEKTIAYQKKVKDIWSKTSPDNYGAQGFIERNIANAYYRKGDYDNALKHLTNSFNYAIPHFNGEDYTVNPDIDQLPLDLSFNEYLDLKSLTLINKFFHDGKTEDLLLSLETCELLIAYNEKITRRFNNESSKQKYINDVYNSFQTAIQAAYELHKQTNDQLYVEKAFNFAEKSKAFLLLENMRSQELRGTAGIPEEILHQEDSLKLKIAQLNNDIFQAELDPDASGMEKITKLKKEHLEAIVAFENLKNTIKKGYGRYFQLKYQKEPIPHSELKASLLGDDDVVLEYFMGSEYLFIFVVDHGGITIHQSSSGEWLEGKVLDLRNIVENRTGSTKKFNAIAHQLYDSLVAPAGEIARFKKLTIIPDGILNYLPFEILVKDKAGGDFKDLPYLIKDHQIVYQYSTNVWYENTVKPEPQEKLNLLAFAPDFNSKQPESEKDVLLIASRDKVRGNLSPLVGTLKELDVLKDLINGETLNGHHANEKIFKEKAGRYGIIHLATHAVIDDENPMRSRLLFTYDSLENEEDGNLYSWELYNMQLNARLAVLSACNTGFGEIRRGEGVMSLGRAFAYAGCPAVIMSLWPAQDEVTADIMAYFYRGLAKKLPKDQALREAKIKYLQRAEDFMAHPFYWASFVAQGDPRPVNIDKKLNTKWLLIAGISVIIIFIAFYAIRKKQPH